MPGSSAWILASVLANACIIAVEYLNHAGGYASFGAALLRTWPLILVAQWGLFVAFSSSPHWMAAWAVFTVGNSLMRVAAVSAKGGEITSYPHILLGVAVMIAGSMVIKEGLS